MLMYHRVCAAPKGVPRPTWNVTPEKLATQLAGLLKRGYRAWPLRRALEASEAGEVIPRNVFVVTFDDGYANNFTQAFPILRELRIPATIFLTTSQLDTGEPFSCDDWSLTGSPDVPAETWRPLTFSECDRLLESPLIELAAHSHTHEDFRGRPDDFAADLVENVRVLRDRLGIERPSFAFPFGTKATGFSGGELADVARRADIRCALTTEDRLVDSGSDPFDWGRFTAHQHDTDGTLAVKLDGWFAWARALVRGRATADDVVGQPGTVGDVNRGLTPPARREVVR